MKLPYREGDWFAVPLPSGGFASGIVARTTKKGRVLLGYFFGPRRPAPESLVKLEAESPESAILVARFGDLSLIRGEWPILGRSHAWDRTEWSMPAFVRRDPLSGRTSRVEYADEDPNAVLKLTPLGPGEDEALQVDSVYGAGAVEMHLDQLLPSKQVEDVG